MLQYLLERLRRARARARHLPRTLALLWAAAGRWTAAWAALLLVQGLLPVATVYLTREVVNRLVAAIKSGGGWEALAPALMAVAGLAGVALLGEVLRGAANWVRANQAERVQDHISSLIQAKSAEVDLAFYDSPEFFDRLHRARAEASHRPVALVETLGALVQNGLTLAAMLAVLIPFGAWLPAALVASTLPAIVVVLRYSLRQHALRVETTVEERRAWYYDWLLTSREPAAELRLFGLAGFFQRRYQVCRGRVRDARLRLARRQSVAELGAGAAGLAISGGAMALMVARAVRGAVSLGDLALFYQAFQQGMRLMRSLLDSLAQLYTNTLFLGDLYDFLAFEPAVRAPERPAAPPAAVAVAIRFEDVTFRYPGSPHPVLRHFSLEIPAGRLVALVGPNGAGKSTLAKLLCRFYDPEAGRIELDGTDLREFAPEELRRRITLLFQEPVRYNATAAESIALGDAALDPAPERVERAAQAAGAAQIIAELPRGYDNLLGRWLEDGAELSAGQWQRIALARAFYRDAPIILLDEPTSAMDPWAEAEWLERLRALAAGRTAILITHRLTTAMRADIIHVIAGGEVIESGSHDELLRRGGLYAQSWTNQVSSEWNGRR